MLRPIHALLETARRAPARAGLACVLLVAGSTLLTSCNRIEAMPETVTAAPAPPAMQRQVYTGPSRPTGAHFLRTEQSGARPSSGSAKATHRLR